jgi:hypothetical protein
MELRDVRVLLVVLLAVLLVVGIVVRGRVHLFIAAWRYGAGYGRAIAA